MRLSSVLSAGILAFAMAAGGASAETDWPTRAVTVVVPVNAGGGADAQARTIADELSKLLGQPFVIDFRPGAAMMIGADSVVRSAPDGYTIMYSASTALVNAAVNPNATYDPTVDLLPVTRTTGAPYFISAHADTPYNTYDELIDFAKANPGEVDAGVAGFGSAGHYAMSLVQANTGALFNLVPYSGAGAIVPDLMSGTIDITFGNSTAYIAAVQSGSVKYIASMSEERSPLVSDVEAIGETRHPGSYGTSWYGFTVPNGTPSEIIEKLRDATVTVLMDPEVNKRLNDLGFVAIGDDPEDMARVIQEEIAEMKGLMEAGIYSIEIE